MRKLIALVAVAALAVALPSTAVAAKPKKVHETFGATLAPFPKLAAWGDPLGLTQPGCLAGQEGVHWVAQDFTAPGKGNLRIYMEAFTGDHDLYVFLDEIIYGRSENAQVPVGSTDVAPPEEEVTIALKKGQTITMVGCNWLGQPDLLVHYDGTFK